SSWTAAGTGTNNLINSLTEYNGQLYAGGRFTMAGTVNASRVARMTAPNAVAALVTAASFSLYPNPGKGKFTISGTAEAHEVLRIQVSNAAGQLMLDEKIPADVTGSYRRSFDLKGAASGLYFLKLESDKRREMKSLMIE